MNKTVFFILIFLKINVVLSQETLDNKFNLIGQLKNLENGSKVILLKVDLSNFVFTKIDSTIVKNESFEFNGKINNKDDFMLRFIDVETNNLIGSFFLFLDSNVLRIVGDLKKQKTIKVLGSNMFNFSKKYGFARNEVRNEMKSKGITDYRIIQSKMRSKTLKLIFENPNNYFSLNKLITSIPTISNDSIILFYSRLNEKMKITKQGVQIRNHTPIQVVSEGDYYYNFTAKNIQGEDMSLSDFIGKVIILDFWASWCPPCHIQNQNEFPSLLKKFKGEDFVIISYSVDIDKDKWTRSSKKDNITWINLSNLLGVKDPLIVKYGVRGYPTTIIIDQSGKISNITTGSIDGLLESKLKKLFKK